MTVGSAEAPSKRRLSDAKMAWVARMLASPFSASSRLSTDQLLIREVRHRVENSLQIVASTLLLGARSTHSEDVRAQILSAHSRIMAIAELERRLCNRSTETVDLDDYLLGLCACLSDAVIMDAGRVKLVVAVSAAQVSATTASSLGMIVSELVTNAQKHAFPQGRRGTILVTYEAVGQGWQLRVSDDGAGLGESTTKVGLGSEIVRALSRQLGATVAVERAETGVTVSVVSAGAKPRAPRPYASAHHVRI